MRLNAYADLFGIYKAYYRAVPWRHKIEQLYDVAFFRSYNLNLMTSDDSGRGPVGCDTM
jgi:hypothetical protein